jgi:hypothetical protein
MIGDLNCLWEGFLPEKSGLETIYTFQQDKNQRISIFHPEEGKEVRRKTIPDEMDPGTDKDRNAPKESGQQITRNLTNTPRSLKETPNLRAPRSTIDLKAEALRSSRILALSDHPGLPPKVSS